MTIYTHESYALSFEEGRIIKAFNAAEDCELELKRSVGLKHKALPGLQKELETLYFEAPGYSLLSEVLDNRLNINKAAGLINSFLDLLIFLEEEKLQLSFFHPALFLFNNESEEIILIDYALVEPTSNSSHLTSKLSLEKLHDYLPTEYSYQYDRSPGISSIFYSVGVLLYKVFTGTNPFEEASPTMAEYKHLSVVPLPPVEQSPLLAKSLSDLIVKCLNKKQDNRYRSIHGFQSDFDSAMQLQFSNQLDKTIELGLDDLPNEFNLEKEVEFRDQDFNQVISFLTTNKRKTFKGICILNGQEGSGKSHFLQQVIKSVDPAAFTSAYGSFEDDSRLPFYGFKMVLRQIVTKIISHPDDQVDRWRTHVIENSQNEISTIVDFDNELSILFKANNFTTKINDQGTLINRLVFSFKVLLESVHEFFGPTLICLDNLDKASRSSLRFLESLIGISDLTTFRILLAYEENTQNNNLPSFLNKIRQNSIGSEDLKVEDLSLEKLTKEQIANVLEKLNINFSEDESLLNWLLDKTDGRPKRFENLLLELVSQSCIIKDQDGRTWKLDYSRFSKHKLESSNDASYESLTRSEQTVLRLGIFLGSIGPQAWMKFIINTFLEDQGAYTTLMEKDYIKIRDDLGAGLWFAIEDSELTNHITSSIELEDEIFVKTISSLLIDSNKLLELESNHIFLITQNVFDQGLSEDIQIKPLLLEAIARATAEGAFENASRYYKPIIEAYLASSANSEHEEMMNHISYFLQILNQAGSYSSFDTYFTKFEAVCRNDVDQMILVDLKCKRLMFEDYYQEALDLGLAQLRKQGVRISSNPKTFHIVFALIKLDRAIKKRDLESIENLPRISDPEKLVILSILRTVSSAVFLVAPKLIAEVFSSQIRLSLKFGLDSGIGIAFSSYAFILTSFTKDVDRGFEMAEFSEMLNKSLDDPPSRCITNFITNLFVDHWRYPLSQIIERLNRNYQYSMQNGDLNMAFFSLAGATVYDFFDGQYIPRLFATAKERYQLFAGNKDSPTKDMFQIVIQACEDLSAETIPGQIMAGEYFNLDEKRQGLIDSNNYSPLLIAITIRNLIKYLKEDTAPNKEDEDFLIFTNKTLGQSSYTQGVGQFLACLFQLKTYGKHSSRTKKIFSAIKQRRSFQHIKLRYEILNALLLLNKGKDQEALVELDRVVSNATRDGSFIERLVALKERYSILIQTGQHRLAKESDENIIKIVRGWGAKAVISEANKIGAASEVDFSALIRATNSLSAEMDIGELVNKIFTLLSDHFPETTLSLFDLEQNLVWRLKDGQEKPSLEKIDETQLPSNLRSEKIEDNRIYSVADPKSHSDFSDDAYFESSSPGSIVYSQITGNASKLGTLFIESKGDELTNTSTLDIIQLIVSQAKIALEKVTLDRNYQIAESEKRRSDELLHNILPENAAFELKEKGKVAAKYYDDVTVMLADIKGFTTLSEKLSPQELIETIDFLYQGFDEIIESLGLEKIKTIGDAYLAVGGMPEGNQADPQLVIEAAIKIQDFIIKNKVEVDLLELRIGIHSGPVIAGVVGLKRYQYDIWGDTVNITARMEQASEPGKINISEATYNKVKDKINCTPRGKIASKNKGDLEMYYVSP